MEVADVNQNNDTEKAEGSFMENKLGTSDKPEEMDIGSTDHSTFCDEVSKQNVAKPENEHVKTSSIPDGGSDFAKNTAEISEDTIKFGFPLENLNLCNIISQQEKENNTSNSLCDIATTDENVIARNTVNCGERIAVQWDTNILGSVSNADLVCSEIENYLKNNLNLPNVPRRETQPAKPGLNSSNSTNELFKSTTEISSANTNNEKVEPATSVERTILDKLTGIQNNVDLCANILFGHHESVAEMRCDLGSNNLHGENFPISFAGVTTCESIEKNMSVTTNSCSSSEKSTDHQNAACEVAAKPTSTIDFLSGSFQSEETSDSPREKNRGRNIVRNVVVAKLSEVHAKNMNESNKIAVEDDTKVKESNISAASDGFLQVDKPQVAVKSQADSMKCMQTMSSDSEDDSSDSSFNSSTFDDSEDSSSTISAISKKKDIDGGPKKWHQPKTKGELGLEDLPPIQDLHISVEEKELEEMGIVTSIVEELVVVQGNHDRPALDLDSVLFLEGGKPLGQVFDVFGPVVQPSYAVRFNSSKEISERGITKGCKVYSAPTRTEITKYVFAEELSREKGSDASWKNNNEPPEQHLDYSDDEKEKEAKKRGKSNNAAAVKTNDKPLTTNKTPPLRPPVFQVPRLPPNSPHPGFPFGPPPPLPPFASRYPGAAVFGSLPFRPTFTSNNNNISFCVSTQPPPPPPPPPPIPPGSSADRSIPFSMSSRLPPPPPPVHPPGNPLHNSMYCPTVQHNMFGPYGTTLPSFSRSTDINTARPLMPPSRIGVPSVAPFPPPPFATAVPSRRQFS